MPIQAMNCPKCGKPASEYSPGKWQCLTCGTKFVYEKPPDKTVHEQRIEHTGTVTLSDESYLYQCPGCKLSYSKLTEPPNTCTMCGVEFCRRCFGVGNLLKERRGPRHVTLCLRCSEKLAKRHSCGSCLFVCIALALGAYGAYYALYPRFHPASTPRPTTDIANPGYDGAGPPSNAPPSDPPITRRRRPSAPLIPAIETYLDAHREYGDVYDADPPKDTRQGTEQRISTSQGTYTFVTADSKVTGIKKE
jgi:hypothetical protein